MAGRPPLSLVIAAIEGGQTHQTWENFGRALDSAGALVEDDGAIAVCCELAAAPGPGVQSIAAARSRRSALKRIRKIAPPTPCPPCNWPGRWTTTRSICSAGWTRALVEDLDMIPLAGGDELARLARRHRSCILVANAPRTVVTVEEK